MPDYAEGLIQKKKKIFEVLFLASVLIGNAAFLKYNAFRCFNFLDMGSILDASWRTFIGQRPYLDFIYYNGPLHLYANAFFFHLFGFGKTAILAHILVIHSLIILLVYGVLRRKVSLWITLIVTLLVTPSFFWSISHPWHDQSAHFWGILTIILFLWQFPFKHSKNAMVTAAICGVLGVLSFLAKTNIGTAYCLALFFIFLSCSPRSKTIGGYFIGLALGGVLALIIIRYPAQYIEQSLYHSQAVKEARLLSLLDISRWFKHYYWIPLLITLGNAFIQKQKHLELLVLLGGITFVGIFSANTGGMLVETNNFLWGIQMGVAFLIMYKIGLSLKNGWRAMAHRTLLGFLTILTAVLTVISVKYGLELKVWTYTGHNPVGDYVIQTEPFKGWLAHRHQGEPLDNLAEYIKQIPKDQTLLNMTDMYILYALTGRDSFRGIPFLFLPEILPAKGKQTEIVREYILSHPPDWIIVDVGGFNNEVYFLGLQNFVKSSYQPVIQNQTYFLLKRK